VWKRSLTNSSEVREVSSTIPRAFSLGQNYPNPFNPSTKIQFHLASSAFTSLKVYNVLGKEAATLVNDYLQPGNYESTFDASHLSSGLYFYQLQTGNLIDAKKMNLIK
jgi:hypothetical protein